MAAVALPMHADLAAELVFLAAWASEEPLKMLAKWLDGAINFSPNAKLCRCRWAGAAPTSEE